ncbi:MAG TPA: hypothetical protein VE961_15330 [Pyrinomonadaceae bacterium]|nr:hypothetical protein [Pyrinomonadaceae bacterium]
MQDEEEREQKEPIEMNTDEALDFVFHPEIAKALRREAGKTDLSDEPESEDKPC